MTIDEMIAVLQAAKEGKRIECRHIAGMAGPAWPEWMPCTPSWDFNHYDYRVKPEPREWWVALYDQTGLCGGLFSSKEAAEAGGHIGRLIRVREVRE